jgi:hypothetical protein
LAMSVVPTQLPTYISRKLVCSQIAALNEAVVQLAPFRCYLAYVACRQNVWFEICDMPVLCEIYNA